MKIVVACDSFKGSLSSAEVNHALAEGIECALGAGVEIVEIPMADGGEGTADILINALGAERVTCKCSAPMLETITAEYGIVKRGNVQTAIMDVASVVALSLVPPERRNPLIAVTTGVGEMIADAYGRGCRDFIIGLGGTATCDAGIGMLSILDNCHRTECSYTLISDVTNPLLGNEGAARVFAPQKGATPEQVEELEKRSRNFVAKCCKINPDVADCHRRPGAGAAGGLGYAFLLLGGKIVSGVDSILDIVRFDDRIRGADLVITGEGSIDSQTRYGKVPYGVCLRAEQQGIPTVAVGGCVDNTISPDGDCKFAGVFPIMSRPMSLDEAMLPDTTRRNLHSIGASIARLRQASRR